MTMRKNRRYRVGVIGGALIVVSAWFEIPAIGQRPVVNSGVTSRPVTPRGDLSADEKSTIDLFQKARASVVYINTRERVVDPWTRNMFSIPRGTGSGFVWDGRGHIVTNFHVIAEASEARVRLSDGRDPPATLVGASPDHDLAVLRLNVSARPRLSPLAQARISRSDRRYSR
jgi:S1-C subfamily serine protease